MNDKKSKLPKKQKLVKRRGKSVGMDFLPPNAYGSSGDLNMTPNYGDYSYGGGGFLSDDEKKKWYGSNERQHRPGEIWRTKAGKWGAKSNKDSKIYYFGDKGQAERFLDRELKAPSAPLMKVDDPYASTGQTPLQTKPTSPDQIGKIEDPYDDLTAKYINKDIDPSDMPPDDRGYDVVPDDEDSYDPYYDDPGYQSPYGEPKYDDDMGSVPPGIGVPYTGEPPEEPYPSDDELERQWQSIYGEPSDVEWDQMAKDAQARDWGDPDNPMTYADDPSDDEPNRKESILLRNFVPEQDEFRKWSDPTYPYPAGWNKKKVAPHRAGDVWRTPNGKWGSKDIFGAVRYSDSEEEAWKRLERVKQSHLASGGKLQKIYKTDPETGKMYIIDPETGEATPHPETADIPSREGFPPKFDPRDALRGLQIRGLKKIPSSPKEAAPSGWEGTVKALKKHKNIDNPWALAHWMKKKGWKSHKKEHVERLYNVLSELQSRGITSLESYQSTFDPGVVDKLSDYLPQVVKEWKEHGSVWKSSSGRFGAKNKRGRVKYFKEETKAREFSTTGSTPSNINNLPIVQPMSESVIDTLNQLWERNYRQEYDRYQSRPEQKKRRAQRNKSRRRMERSGRVRKGDGKDVHHRDGNPFNQDSDNTAIMSKSKNRSIKERKQGMLEFKVRKLIRERLKELLVRKVLLPRIKSKKM